MDILCVEVIVRWQNKFRIEGERTIHVETSSSAVADEPARRTASR